jgi:hypothetical protein
VDGQFGTHSIIGVIGRESSCYAAKQFDRGTKLVEPTGFPIVVLQA